MRNQISYDLSIRDEHNITMLAGTEIRKNIHEIDNRIVYGYNENTKQHISLNEQQMIAGVTGGTIVDPNSQTSSQQSFTNGFGTGYVKYDKRFFSLYANAAYDYKSKYGLNASIRVDQANLFGTDIRYKPIWSVGVLWNLHHEDFWNRDLFDRFTFRISRGIAGNTPNSEVGDLTTSLVLRDMGTSRSADSKFDEYYFSCLEESEMGKNDDHQFGNRFFYLAKQVKRFG